MKRLSIFSLILLITLTACGTATNGYQLKGTLSKQAGLMLYLDQIKGSDIITIDSVKISDKGAFTFTKKVPVKDFYRLRISPNNVVFLVLDPKESVTYTNDNIQLQENYTLLGSKEGDLILEIKNIRQEINHHRDSLMKIMQDPTISNKDSLQRNLEMSFNEFVGGRLNHVREIIKKNPEMLATITAAELLDADDDFGAYSTISENLKKSYPNSGYAQSFIQRVEQMRVTAIGATAPEINLPNPEGTPIGLSSLRGKVVLIDFWASWCGPCRKENPNVVKLYNAYKDKGFDIYSVSLDKGKDNWVKAIQQDGLIWPSHVSDLAYWSSSVVKQYGFQGIPFTVLIDGEGKIVGKGLRGPQLEAAVAKLLN